MTNDRERADAARQYASAHLAHYSTRDLHEALDLYKGVMVAHPRTLEAGYSRTQILNIVDSVVPEQELLEAQLALARSHLEQVETSAERDASARLQRRRDEVDTAWEAEKRTRREAETERRTEARRKGAR